MELLAGAVTQQAHAQVPQEIQKAVANACRSPSDSATRPYQFTL